jgi:hypothetical protein
MCATISRISSRRIRANNYIPHGMLSMSDDQQYSLAFHDNEKVPGLPVLGACAISTQHRPLTPEAAQP